MRCSYAYCIAERFPFCDILSGLSQPNFTKSEKFQKETSHIHSAIVCIPPREREKDNCFYIVIIHSFFLSVVPIPLKRENV